MKAIFLIIREITIDDVTYTDVEGECYSNLPDAKAILDMLSESEFTYSIRVVNLIN